MGKIIIIIFLLFQQAYILEKHTFYGQLVSHADSSASRISYDELLKDVTEFEIYELDASAIFDYSNTQNRKPNSEFTLKMGNKHHWELKLTAYNLFSNNFRRVTATSNGKEISYNKPRINTYRGYNTNENQKVVMSLGPDWIYGFVTNKQGARYFIEPLQLYNAKAKANQYIVYNSSTISNNEYVCGQNGQGINDEVLGSDTQELSRAVVCLETAIAYDQSTKNLIGGQRAVENVLTSRFNSVSAFFLDNFEIEKKIVEFYEAGLNEITSETSVIPCYESFFPNSCGVGSILENFRQWNESEFSGFSSNPQAATFFTGRSEVEQYAGYSYIGGICTDKAYNWVDATASSLEYLKVNLWIHEYGHTWNGDHLLSTGTSMMSPTISYSDPMPVIDRTQSRITAHKNSRGCLNIGSCESTLNTNNSTLKNVKIFPNPTTDIIHIREQKGLEIVEIYSSLGQKIIQTHQLNIDVNGIADGIYFLKISDINGAFVIKKFIKK